MNNFANTTVQTKRQVRSPPVPLHKKSCPQLPYRQLPIEFEETKKETAIPWFPLCCSYRIKFIPALHQPLQDGAYEGVDAVLVVGVGAAGHTVGNDHAAGESLVAKEFGETGYCATFHLEVRDLPRSVAEGFDFVVGFGVGQGEAELAALGTEETAAGYGDAAHHICTRHALQQFLVGVDHIGMADALRTDPLHVVQEGSFEIEVAHFVTPGIEVEQAVEAHADGAGNEGACGYGGLEATTGADAHYLELAQFGSYETGGEVDIGQGIQFVEHNVDVVTADTRGDYRDALATETARDSAEFAARNVALDVREMGSYQGDSPGVAHEDDFVGQLLGPHMEVKDAAIGMDNQLLWGYGLKLLHGV